MELQDFLKRYINDPVAFVEEVLGFPDEFERARGLQMYPWQREVLQAVAAGSRRIAIRSGHGVGKTTLLAWLTLWHACFRFPQRTAVTAPTEKQLYNAYWADVKVWHGRLPEALRSRLAIKGERLELVEAPGESYVSLATARKEQPEALQGVHSPGYVLLLVDEASGVPDAVFEAALGSMSGERTCTVLTGNPTRSRGFFYDAHTSPTTQWDRWRVSCLDVPGVDRDFIEHIAATYGRDSNVYRVRILGEFPLADDDTVIPREVIEAAIGRDVSPLPGPVIWGVDPAGRGKDRSALAKRRRNVLLEPVKWWAGLEGPQLVGRILQEYRQTPPKDRPAVICVDAIGLGVGIADGLRAFGLPVRHVNVSETRSLSEQGKQQFLNLRAQLWFRMREWFMRRDVKLPEYYRVSRPDNPLIDELAQTTFGYTPNGKVVIEPKSRRTVSPDLAEALLMTFAAPAGLMVSGGARRTWDRPIRSNLKLVV